MDDAATDPQYGIIYRKQFAASVAKRLAIDVATATCCIDAVLDEIYAGVVRGEAVELGGFGHFEKRELTRRNGRVDILPAFRAGDDFRRKVNRGSNSFPAPPVDDVGLLDREIPTGTDPSKVTITKADRIMRQRERELLLDYETYLGYALAVRTYRVAKTNEQVVCDAYDKTRNEIVEAKADSIRANVRMALGQLLDYRRHEPRDPALAILLPDLPNEDLQDLLAEHGVTLIWRLPHRAGFERRAGKS